MGVGLDGPGGDAERGGDLGLGEVEVVAEGQHLALAVGERPQRGQHALVVAGRGPVPPGRRRRVGAPPRRWRRSTPRRRRCDRAPLSTALRR